MKNFCKYVNIFMGCDPVHLPKRKGFAFWWKPIKGLCGNTSPASCLPFGKMSCVAYSGAYPTGYGNCKVNSHNKIPKMFRYHQFLGLSHVHQSGTGFIDYFYNFALTAPAKSLEEAFLPRKILSEEGEPGYYACQTEREKASCVVTADSAFHRFECQEKSNVYIRLSQYGLNQNQPNKKIFTLYDTAECRIEGNTALCKASFYGVPVYFAVRSKRGTVPFIWTEKGRIAETKWCAEKYSGEFGIGFEEGETVCETVLSLSYRSEEKAFEYLVRDGKQTFEEVKTCAKEKWNETFSKVEIEGSEEEKILFYSNLYHSLVKPVDISDENLYGFDGEAVCDLATLWDLYKTQLPFVFMLYPEMGNKVIQTMISYRKKYHTLPNSYLIAPTQSAEESQAKFLTAPIFAEAYLHGIGDKKELFETLKEEYFSKDFESFRQTGKCSRTTHTMDMYEGKVCLALLAEGCGEKTLADELHADYEKMSAVYSPKTGLLQRKSEYYEGNEVNYSFRLHANGDFRVRCAGGKERLTELLDGFFGFRKKWDRHGKFEGFNNETDMETPYCYHFVGRHDRINEILDASRKYCWRATRGGIPGNNDTGALSTLYIWNALGIFPMAGQDKTVFSYPIYPKSTLYLPSGELIIEREGKGIYVEKVTFNGQPLPDLEIKRTALLQGGVLHFTMKENKE